MNITQSKFEEMFPEMFEYSDIFYKDFTSDEQFINEYLTSKLWRLNNLYTIIDKDGERIPFVMNMSQLRVYQALSIHERLIILKSRQQGISTFWLIYFFDDAMFEKDFNIGLMAQGKEEAATLLERVKLAWEQLDDSIKQFLNVSLDKDNSTEFSFSNNCTIFIRTSFRSATLQRLHISELGKIANKFPKRAKETNTGTLQAIKAGNIVAIESTAEGNNMFKDKWDQAYNHKGPLAGKDFLAVFLSWIDDPDCIEMVPQIISKEHAAYFLKIETELKLKLTDEQKWFWVVQYRELQDGEVNDIHQEYPSTPEEAFMAARDGTYYAPLYQKHVVTKGHELIGLLDTNLDVDVIWELGMNDDMVLGFWQSYDSSSGASTSEERCVHEYSNSGEGLEHYVNYVQRWLNEHGATIGETVCPHDIRVKELGTGISRKKRLHELGVRRIRVLRKAAINDGIEAVRKMIPSMYIDPQECSHVIDGFKNYSKEWDDVRGVWKDKPLHDKWSHPMDMVRYRAMSLKRYNGGKKEKVRENKWKGSGRSRKVSGGYDV